LLLAAAADFPCLSLPSPLLHRRPPALIIIGFFFSSSFTSSLQLPGSFDLNLLDKNMWGRGGYSLSCSEPTEECKHRKRKKQGKKATAIFVVLFLFPPTLLAGWLVTPVRSAGLREEN
jgi:hypothetical protein